jgi:hypothetical protein
MSVYRAEVSELTFWRDVTCLYTGWKFLKMEGPHPINYVRSHNRIQQSSRDLILENSYVTLSSFNLVFRYCGIRSLVKPPRLTSWFLQQR